jgi:hypothetical protein
MPRDARRNAGEQTKCRRSSITKPGLPKSEAFARKVFHVAVINYGYAIGVEFSQQIAEEIRG